MKKLLLIIVVTLFSGSLWSQNSCPLEQLISSLRHDYVVYKKAAGNEILSLGDTIDIFANMSDDEVARKIPKTVIRELILKTQKKDSSVTWENKYFPGHILIDGNGDKLDFKRLCKELAISPKSEQGIAFKKFVDKWNRHGKDDYQSISYMSYPIFDNTCQYAIVTTGYSCGILCGRSMTNIYMFDGTKWVMAIILRKAIS